MTREGKEEKKKKKKKQGGKKRIPDAPELAQF